ncbi:hypothetical protein ACOZDE_18775 [Streptomyces griseoincarnatus]
MGDLQLALVAAGSALAGSALTGWFTVLAGRRQASAAKYAGDKQAEAVLLTVRQTLDEQRASRQEEARRTVYAGFLTAAERKREELNPGSRPVPTTYRSDATTELDVALRLVELEGPPAVFEAAQRVQALLARPTGDDMRNREHYVQARAAYIAAAQRALRNQ